MDSRDPTCLARRPGEITVAVQMRSAYRYTERPRAALLQPATGLRLSRWQSDSVNAPPADDVGTQTQQEHWLVGSFTGTVASQTVPEASKGTREADGDRRSHEGLPQGARAGAYLTERPRGRTDVQARPSDPADRMEGTPSMRSKLRRG